MLRIRSVSFEVQRRYELQLTRTLPQFERTALMRATECDRLDVVEYLVEHGADVNVKTNVRNSRSEEHTSELQSLMRISYAVFCLKKTTKQTNKTHIKHKSKY